ESRFGRHGMMERGGFGGREHWIKGGFRGGRGMIGGYGQPDQDQAAPIENTSTPPAPASSTPQK
ncbi:MAG: hypothetical protein HY979_00740, partial [Candidatus Magasanikbacteria bacterium]|nr:hypothetical protein [Candidatus Magasanikbacteria bacterium]